MRQNKRQKPIDILNEVFFTKEFKDLDTTIFEKSVLGFALNNKCLEEIFSELNENDFSGRFFFAEQIVPYRNLFGMAKWCYNKFGSIRKETIAKRFQIPLEELEKEFEEGPAAHCEYYIKIIRINKFKETLVCNLVSLIIYILDKESCLDDIVEKINDLVLLRDTFK